MTNETYISYETSIGGKIILKRWYTHHKVPHWMHLVASDTSLFLHHPMEDLLIHKIILRKFGHDRCEKVQLLHQAPHQPHHEECHPHT